MCRFLFFLLCFVNSLNISVFASDDDNLPPVPKWALKCDGNVTGATVTDMPEDPKIRAGLDSIRYDDAQSYNYNFQYEEFEPGKVSTTIWRLKIIDVRKDAKAVITFSDTAGNDTTIIITYTSVKLKVDPVYFDFGKIPFSSESTAPFTVTNLSEINSVVLNKVKFKYGNQN